MKKLTALLLTANISLFAGAIFETDYTANEGPEKAVTAGNGKNLKILFETSAKINFDTMAHSVRGVKVGKDNASLRYESTGNLPPSKGSFEVTFSGDWSGDDTGMNTLAQSVPDSDTEAVKFYLYKYKQSGIAVYLEIPKEKKKLFLNLHVKDWKPESWHHLLVTYEPGTIKLYVDGLLARSGEFPEIRKWTKYFTIGSAFSKLGRDNETTIASFAVYDRPLTPDEAAGLAKRRLPELHLTPASTGTVSDDILLAPSPWFEKRPAIALEALDDTTVPPPWTPMEIRNDKIFVWNRCYDLSGDALVKQMSSSETELLSSPLQLIMNGQELHLSPVRPIKVSDGRIRLERTFTAVDDVRGTVEYLLEYDGMIWCTLKIQAPGKTLRNLSLRIPLRRENSELFHFVGAPRVYESQNLVKNSFSMALSMKAGTIWESPLRTNLWFGNNKCGLQWFLESDQFHYPKDRKNMIRLVRNENGSLECRIDMVASELPPAHPDILRYEFGFLATPVKALPKGWRGFTFSAQYDSFKGQKRGNHLIYWPDQWRSMSLDPDPYRARELEKNRKRLQEDRMEKRKIIPYWTRLHYPTRSGKLVNPDRDILSREWLAEPHRPGGGNHQYDRAATTSSWQDYLVWCTQEWASIFGWTDGVYMDETQPIPNENAVSGGGYDDFNGERRPTYESFGSRNLIKRINYLIWKRTGKEPSSIAHCSATHTMQNIGHYSVMLIGEQFYSGYFKNRNQEFLPPSPEEELYYYSYALPLDRLRTECYHRQWGAVMLWLPCLKNRKDLMKHPVPARDMLSRIMQADMLVWPIFCNLEEVYKTWKFRSDFKIESPDVTFHPYWEQTLLQPAETGILCGVYKKGDALLAIVSNLNRKTAEVNLRLREGQLKSVKDAENLQSLPFSGNRISISIPRNDYRALRINY